MKAQALLATSLVAFLAACGTSNVAPQTDASVADAGANVGDANVSDENNSDTGSPDAAGSLHVRSVVAGAGYTCVILDDNSVKCWGNNADGQLGLGDQNNRGDSPNEMGDILPKVDLGKGRTAKTLSAGGHTCVILDDNSVKCWGNNTFFGQLGQGDTNNRGDSPNEMGDKLPKVDLGAGRTAKAISVGDAHTCVILDDNSVKCWGNNADGQLGLGDQNDRGDSPNEMGDMLPKVDLGAGRTAKTLSAGGRNTCAILDDDSVKCWGYNRYGELGLGDQNRRGGAPKEMGDMLPKVDLGTGRTAKALSARGGYSCVILDDGNVKCWGYNDFAGLGLGDTSNRGDAPKEMGDMLPKVDLGTGRTAKAISAGAYHTCAILDDNGVKCWGENGVGELGLGDTSDRGDAPNEMGDMLASVDLGTGRIAVGVSVGSSHTCVNLDDNSVKCWGDNHVGKLGLGDIKDRGDAPKEMGDMLPKVDLGTK